MKNRLDCLYFNSLLTLSSLVSWMVFALTKRKKGAICLCQSFLSFYPEASLGVEATFEDPGCLLCLGSFVETLSRPGKITAELTMFAGAPVCFTMASGGLLKQL